MVILLLPQCTIAASPPWMDARAPPKLRAAQLVAAMTTDEKLDMLHGSCGGYTGNVCANTRLGIPALKMNDGPQGFRGAESTSTAFPSAITIAATWSTELAQRWGEAMGDEFYRKGANVQLGPGLCLARVPRNGRTFEYISGEDPYLGFQLAGAAVAGIQSQGVVANAKHWVVNNVSCCGA
jgi:beta-glucosidase